MHILVVDDEPDMRRLSAVVLKSAGHSAERAGTIAEALALLGSQSYDVALLDINLGDESGLALARVMREAHPQTAVIMVTGRADFTSVNEARIAGALDYLVKPFEATGLIEAVNRVGATRQRRTPGVVSAVELTVAPSARVPAAATAAVPPAVA